MAVEKYHHLAAFPLNLIVGSFEQVPDIGRSLACVSFDHRTAALATTEKKNRKDQRRKHHAARTRRACRHLRSSSRAVYSSSVFRTVDVSENCAATRS